MFILLARDPIAPDLVRIWTDRRQLLVHDEDPGKLAEARQCADAMAAWRTENEGAWRQPQGEFPDTPFPASLAEYNLGLAAVKRLTAGKDQVRLGELTRAVDQAEPALAGRITVRDVSGMLRRFRFSKTGLSGSGIDREPVYTREDLL